MKNPLWWETVAHNVALLKKAPLDPTGLPAGLVADGRGQIYAKGSSSGRYYSFVNVLMLAATSRLSWATEKTCLGLEAIPGLLVQLLHFHHIVNPAEMLVLPLAPDGFVTYDPFIRWVIDIQNWPIEEVNALSVPAFRVAVQTLRAAEVIENANRVMEIVEESQTALQEGVEPSAGAPKAPLELMREQLHGKEVIIETLQAEIESVQTKIKELQEKLEKTQPSEPKTEAPLAAPASPPAFVVEEERARITASIAKEIRLIDRALRKMEAREGSEEIQHPPPLALARDIGLSSTGRTPRPSDEENLDALKQIRERITTLQEAWKALHDQMPGGSEGVARQGKPQQPEGWLQLTEAEVRDLEATVGKSLQQNALLAKANEELRKEIEKLKGS